MTDPVGIGGAYLRLGLPIKAAEQGVIKDVFIVNYGDLPLSADAIELLASYNENHATGKIRELWVLVGESLTRLI